MSRLESDRRSSLLTIGFGALAGVVVAAIVTLNLHILVGLEEGYGASPAEVFDSSVVLGVFDVLLLVVAPVAGAVILTRLRRRGRAGD